MTDPQAAREQMAREWLSEQGLIRYSVVAESDGKESRPVGSTLTVLSHVRIQRLTDLIASIEVRALEEAIKVGEREAYELSSQHDGGQQLAVRMILEAQRGLLRQQAQERTP